MPPAAESSLRLVRNARRHDAASWNALLQQHQLPLYSYLAELTKDREVALDLVQETFSRAVRYIATLREDAKFASWLFGIAHQQWCLHCRKQGRRNTVLALRDEPVDDHIDEGTPDPRDLLLAREDGEQFFALVDNLPELQRITLLLHVLEDFGLEEIATITSVPLGTVKSRLHHAKRSLRALVEEKT